MQATTNAVDPRTTNDTIEITRPGWMAEGAWAQVVEIAQASGNTITPDGAAPSDERTDLPTEQDER